jgi:two-component system chemotaxis response regulator CheB
MSTQIISKANTDALHRVIDGEVFICVQSETEAIGIIDKANDITPGVLDGMCKSISPVIVKVICSEEDYKLIKPAVGMVFEDIKYVNRENSYELYFNPKERIIKASKTVESKVVEEEVVEEIQKEVKVLIVDDSTTICNLLSKIMGLSPHIKVVGTVNDPLEAEAAIKKYSPDVITLDIHMPNMNGVELLKKITPKFKIPAIMISSISMQEGPLVLDALESGAVDYIQKPDMSNFAAIANAINTKIISASKTKHQEKRKTSNKSVSSANINMDDNIILIGASTGGTRALKDVLDSLPENIPPTLIVQHIPAEFSRAFAQRLNDSAKFTVKEATDGDKLIANQVLVAPGGFQMKVVKRGAAMYVEINDDEPVNRFKPSVDYLFDSVAKSSINSNIVAAIFTGMGRDGAKGMLALKNSKNAITIAQDEETSVVFGMPKEAIKLGCVDHIVPLGDAAYTLMKSCHLDVQKKAQ